MHPDDLKKKLRQLAPLAMVKSDTIDFLAKYSELVTAPVETDLTPQIDSGSQYLFLVDGTLAIMDAGNVLTRFSHSDPIAQHHLTRTNSDHYRLVAITDIVYVRINKREYDMSINWQHAGDYEVADIADQHPGHGDWMGHLLRKPMFYKLPSDNLQAMFSRFKPLKLSAGDAVVNQGEPGDHFFVLASGVCQVVRQFSHQARPVVVAELAPGDVFGEESLITNTPRNATIKMTQDGTVMRLAKKDFLTLLNEPLTSWIRYVEAAKLIQDNKVGLLDVRLPTEFNKRRINHSVNVPLPILRMTIKTLDHSRPYIVYCGKGQSSQAAAFILEQHGFETRVLKGGLEGIPQRPQPSAGDRQAAGASKPPNAG